MVTHLCFSDDCLSGELDIISQDDIDDIVSPLLAPLYIDAKIGPVQIAVSCPSLILIILKFKFPVNLVFGIGFLISIGLDFNSVMGFITFSVGRSRGRY